MNPQSDVVSWAMILLLITGIFLLYLALRDWWFNRTKPDPLEPPVYEYGSLSLRREK